MHSRILGAFLREVRGRTDGRSDERTDGPEGPDGRTDGPEGRTHGPDGRTGETDARTDGLEGRTDV